MSEARLSLRDSTRRLLWAVLACTLLGHLLVAAWIGHTALTKRRWMIDTREILYFEYVSDVAELSRPPEALVRDGFRTDPPELVAEWRERLSREVDYLRELPSLRGRSEIETVQALVPLFSKNGGGQCGEYRDLLHQIQRLPGSEGGCCSDHVQVLIALASTLDVFVRQVHVFRHTMAEIWVPSLSKWVFVDPHYAVMARAPDGSWLSFLELRQRYIGRQPVAWQFIGTERNTFARVDPDTHPTYDSPDDFDVAKVVWGNNVFEEDRLDRRLSFLPRPARQFVGLSTGILPGPHLIDDGRAPWISELGRLRVVYLGVPALLAVATVVPLALLWLSRPRRERAPRAAHAGSGA